MSGELVQAYQYRTLQRVFLSFIDIPAVVLQTDPKCN